MAIFATFRNRVIFCLLVFFVISFFLHRTTVTLMWLLIVCVFCLQPRFFFYNFAYETHTKKRGELARDCPIFVLASASQVENQRE